MSDRTFVGLDVHARSTVGYALDPGSGQAWLRRMGADPGEVVGWVTALPGQVQAGYEAGPTGYGLARLLQAAGVPTVVLAPSKIARPAGDKVKTDVRDAQLLAQLLAMGEYASVRIPTEAEESARDLWRLRVAIAGDTRRAKQRIGHLLLRRGIVYDGSTWTQGHLRWLRQVHFQDPMDARVYETTLDTVLFAIDRLKALDADLGPLAAASEYAPVMARLACLRGISTITGYGLATEIGDWQRFTGRSIGAYLGLVPSEHSSGPSRTQGGLTRTGNQHARRLLIEASWQHLKAYRRSKDLLARMAAAGPAAAARGHAGNRRLHHRWLSFEARNKKRNQANAAIARELAGWCWSLATMD
jgi:transposase